MCFCLKGRMNHDYSLVGGKKQVDHEANTLRLIIIIIIIALNCLKH